LRNSVRFDVSPLRREQVWPRKTNSSCKFKGETIKIKQVHSDFDPFYGGVYWRGNKRSNGGFVQRRAYGLEGGLEGV